MNTERLIISIEGPTASGKTALAVALAHHLKTEIISSDSRQCYKEMTIGTAVPTAEEREGITHHMIHSHSVHDKLSAASYAQITRNHIDNIFQKQNTLILVGGSPLYAEAILYGLHELPDIAESVVKETRAMSLEQLQKTLKEADFQSYSRIDLSNRRRLERAIQVYIQSGIKWSDYLSQPKVTPTHRCLRLRIDVSRSKLYERINQRVEQMFSRGLVDEAKQLFNSRSEVINSTVGYFELFAAFEDQYSLNRAQELIQQHSRNFAKRQLTWYRKKEEFIVLSEENALQEALSAIRNLPLTESPPREY